MSEADALRVRQWVSLPGGSCDVRLGTGVIDDAAAVRGLGVDFHFGETDGTGLFKQIG